MKERITERNTNIRRILLVCAVVVILGALLGLLRLWELHRVAEQGGTEDNEEYLWYDDEAYTLRRRVETLLVIGLDTFEDDAERSGYTNDLRADFLLLLVFDHQNKTCSAVHLNRDTMAEITVLGIGGKKVGTVTEQLALAHTYGSGKEDSCRNTARAVSELLGGISVTHYMSVTMDAVAVVNDAVGGVTVTVADDLSMFDPALGKGATVTLMGQQALTYVRSRQGLEEGTNEARMARQRQYIEALYEAAEARRDSGEDISMDTLLEIAEYMVTDSNTAKLDQLLDAADEYGPVEIYPIEGESREGERFMEFYPNKDALTRLVLALFYEPVSE